MLAIVEPKDGLVVLELQASNLGRGRELGAEFLGLQNGAVRKVGTGNAGREAEVVLDLRGSTGLSARGGRIDHGGGQPLRRSVHRRSQTSRASTDHHQVIDLLASGRLTPMRSANVRVDRIPQQRLGPMTTTGVSASLSPKLRSSSPT